MVIIVPPVEQIIAGYWLSVANAGGPERSAEINRADRLLKEAGAAVARATPEPIKVLGLHSLKQAK
jgi:hypothetical protein